MIIRLVPILTSLACLFFLSSCGSKSGEDHNERVLTEVAKLVDAVKSVNGANSDEVEEVFDQAILSIEKVGDELRLLKSKSAEVTAPSDEKRKEFEADLMKVSKEMEHELKSLMETQPALSMKLGEKIMEVMNSVK